MVIFLLTDWNHWWYRAGWSWNLGKPQRNICYNTIWEPIWCADWRRNWWS